MKGFYDEVFPGAYASHENSLHGEWCDRAGVTWGDFQRFLHGQFLSASICEKLIETAPIMLLRIHAASDSAAEKPSWALGLRGHRTDF